ncbi:MAG: DUF4115 domain-containing protein [Magnetospirillum sp.]|nr:DUF4115 domain-containing protein [Magnetospirillum sp.]
MASTLQDDPSANGSDPSPSAVSSPSIGVGAALRAARERTGKDVEAVAKQLLIRRPFLQALEEGRHKDLPGGTYAIGFLRTYAEFLGLDGEEMVRRFRQEAAGDLNARSELNFPSPVSEGRIPTAGIMFVGLLVAAAAAAGWYWLGGRDAKVAELVPPLPDRMASVFNRVAGVGADDKAQPPPAKTEDAAAKPDQAPAAPDATDAASGQPAEAPDASQAKPADKVAVKEDVVPPVEVDDEAKAAPADDAAKATPRQADAAPRSGTSGKPAPAADSAAEAKPAKADSKAGDKGDAKAVAGKPVEKEAKPAAGAATPEDGKAAAKGEAATTAATTTTATATAAPVSEAAKADASPSDARVVIRAAADDCWMQVREMDGRLLVSRLLRKGESYGVPNRPGLTLTVGSAGAVDILVDGKKTASLGQLGQVRRDVSLDPAKLTAAP